MVKTLNIYIISPLNAKNQSLIEKNRKNALKYKKTVQEKLRAYNVRTFAPHAYLPIELNDNIPEEREIAIEFGQKVLNLCQAIAVFTPTELSRGMKAEILASPDKIIIAENECVKDKIKTLFDESKTKCPQIHILDNIQKAACS